MTYKANMELEKRLAKENVRLYRRYRVLTPVFWIYAVLSVIAAICLMGFLWRTEGYMDFFLALTVFGTCTIFLGIPGMLLNIVRISGGRDVFLTRLNQEVVLTDRGLSNSWTPKFRHLEPSDSIECQILYQDITRIDYNGKFRRLEVYGKRSIRKLSATGKHDEIVEGGGKPFLIYHYFHGMDEMMEKISSHSGLQIGKI